MNCSIFYFLLSFLVATSRGFSWNPFSHDVDVDESFENENNRLSDDIYTDEELKVAMSAIREVRCPSRRTTLSDYWDCLWRVSITPDGMYQDILELYLDDPENLEEDEMPQWEELYENAKEQDRPSDEVIQEDIISTITISPNRNSSARESKRRVKRAKADQDASIETYNNVARKAFDLWLSLGKFGIIRKCQVRSIEPGVGLMKFFLCLRDSSSKRFAAQYEKTQYRKDENDWNKREFDNSFTAAIPCTANATDIKCMMEQIYEFDSLYDEDEYTNFDGADPYLDSQISEYLYRYNNLVDLQRQPAWSYNGLDAANQWHKLNLFKFFTPLEESVDIKRMSTLPEFAQTYPGTGEVVRALNSGSKEATKIGSLPAPLNYRWNKDSGFYAYTRYVIPLLDQADIDYYKYKELLSEEYKHLDDLQVVQDIHKKLSSFIKATQEPLDDNEYYGTSTEARNEYLHKPHPTPKFPTEEDIPFVDVYRDFFTHYFDIDARVYRVEKAISLSSNNKTYKANELLLHTEYELGRRVLHYYLEAVIKQLQCLEIILKDSDKRKDKQDVPGFLQKVGNNSECEAFPIFEAMGLKKETKPNLYLYNSTFVSNATLEKIYNSYFERKEARQRYTLPIFPLKFPVCKHNEPSPIDIVTKKGRKSSLHSYSFSDHGYYLKHFFIMFPNDGSHLLTVGIVDGERLDESSVVLKGGAVKGQTLTFQYMYIRFGKDWKSEGSEHRINGKAGQMELQMIFTIAGGSADKLKYWHTLARVQNQMFQAREKLVIILSVLVDVMETHEMLLGKIAEEKTNQDPFLFEPLAHAAYLFRSHKQKFPNPNAEHPRGYVSRDPIFRLVEFLPNATGKFFTYRGSLSWPPCFGYVLWSVFEKRLYMSKRQFDEFAKLPGFGTSDHNRISDNFRRPKDIFVEEESMTQDYAKKQAMMKKRTVDRIILEGVHDPTPEISAASGTGGVVDEEMYTLTEEDLKSSAPKQSGPGKELFLTIPILKGKDYLFKR